MSDTQSTIHQAVRERYGAIARGGASCCGPAPAGDTAQSNACCGSDTSANVSLYEDRLTAGLPVEVTDLSLGCGDPVTIAGLKPGEVVLDLGSGGGIDCFLAGRQVGAAGHVIGVDMTPDMLAKANAAKARMGVTNVEFRHGQIEALPVADSSVDVIMSNCVINLSPDKPAVFREAFRVLKPGGRLAVSDIVTDGAFSDALRADTTQWAECVTGALPLDTYTTLLRDAGFSDVQVVSAVDADGIVTHRDGMPHLFSARVTARKA